MNTNYESVVGELTRYNPNISEASIEGVYEAIVRYEKGIEEQNVSGEDGAAVLALPDLREFKESQWWVKELDEAVASGTDDQKRAVAVVCNMLRVAALVAPTPPTTGEA